MSRQRAGGHYDPKVVEVFCREAPRLFSRLEDGSPWELALADEPGRNLVLSDEQLDPGVRAIVDFTDLLERGEVRGTAGGTNRRAIRSPLWFNRLP